MSARYVGHGTLAGLALGIAIAVFLIGLSALGSLIGLAGSPASASSLIVLLIALAVGGLGGTLGGLVVTLLSLSAYAIARRASMWRGLVLATCVAGASSSVIAALLMRVFALGADPLWVVLTTALTAAGGTFAWFWNFEAQVRRSSR